MYHQPQDAHELLMVLLDAVAKSSARASKDIAALPQLFQGVFIYMSVSIWCDRVVICIFCFHLRSLHERRRDNKSNCSIYPFFSCSLSSCFVVLFSIQFLLCLYEQEQFRRNCDAVRVGQCLNDTILSSLLICQFVHPLSLGVSQSIRSFFYSFNLHYCCCVYDAGVEKEQRGDSID